MNETGIKSFFVLLDDTDELNETVDSTDIIIGRNGTELKNSFNDLIGRYIKSGLIEIETDFIYIDNSLFYEIDIVVPIPDIYNTGIRFDEIII